MDIKTIGLIAAFFFLGYIIGLVESAIKKRNKASKEEAKINGTESLSRHDELPSLLRIKRSNSESLILEMQGETFIKVEDLPIEKRKSLINLLIELRPWVDSTETRSSSNTARTLNKIDIENIKKGSTKFNQDINETEKPGTTGSGGMISEIDAILQERLKESPLNSKGIHLVEAPTGEVLVYIGLDKYEGIEAVPDIEVKRLIQTAIRKWEEKN